MKATYGDFEAKKSSNNFLPPVGQYVAEIQGVRLDKNYSGDRDVIVCMVEITEGEYKGQYHKVFEDQKERFGDSVKYKGTFTLTPYVDGDPLWMKNRFEQNLWCVQESNPGYKWDWDEKKLKGKKIGINVREHQYKGNDGTKKVTTEVGQFETIDDVRNGKCKNMNPRIAKALKDEESNGSSEGFQGVEYGTDVSGNVEVPF